MVILNNSQIADASNTPPSRYNQSSGTAVMVDTGMSISVETVIDPYIKLVFPFISSIPTFKRTAIPFVESEINLLTKMNRKASPLLADIWADESYADYDT